MFNFLIRLKIIFETELEKWVGVSFYLYVGLAWIKCVGEFKFGLGVLEF